MFFSAARGGVRPAEKRVLDRRAQPGGSLSWEDVKRSPEGACDGGGDATFRTGRSLHRVTGGFLGQVTSTLRASGVLICDTKFLSVR